METTIKNHVLIVFALMLGNVVHAQSDAFKPAFVDQLVTPYLQIQASLAGDDLAAAKVGAGKFLQTMKAAPDAKNAKELNANFKQSATAISNAADIKSARAAFLDLSQGMIPLIKHIGTTNTVTLYVTHCPMAFQGKGGDWVQSNQQVANPYYGAMMLRCGSVKEQIAGKKSN